MVNTISSRDLSQKKSNPSTVIVADDHPVVREALKNELEKEADFAVIAEARDGEEAVKLVAELNPDVVIMDIGMPKLNGIEATRRIRALPKDTIVLVLTIYDDIEHILEILRSGADGYLTKNVLVKDIIQSIRLAIAGEAILSSEVFQQVLKYALRHSTRSLVTHNGIKLTKRELEILKMVGMGMSNKQIACNLNLGTRTVKSHLVDVFLKLEVSSRTEAVITGLRLGLFKLDDMV